MQHLKWTSPKLSGKLTTIRFLVVPLCFLMLTGAGTQVYAQVNSNIKATIPHVKGRITGPNNQPISGASIMVKGKNLGTSTNENGEFTIPSPLPSNAVLVISSVGYATKEVPVNGQAELTIALTAVATDLDQVIVVGYGTQRKRDVTGAVTSVSEQTLKEVPSANIQGALQGKAAGLEIQTTGTLPGADMQIRIRGARSISGSNAPLLILDGIPYDGSLNDINPDDVASIEVLKDASATAIYGSRGANGVLLVSTKRGKPGQAKITYTGYYGQGNVAWKYPVFNAQQYQALRTISTYTQGYMPIEQVGLAKGTNTNWQDALYQTARKTNHNLSVSGGNSDGTTYSLGAGYYQETAVLPGENYTRYAVRATIDTRVGKNLRVGINSLNNVGLTNGTQFVQYGMMFPLISLSPLSPIDTNGVIVKAPAGNPNDGNTYNPVYVKSNNNNWVDKTTRLRTFNSLYAEYQFIPGLKYRFNLGLSYTQEEDDQFKGQDTKTTPQYFNAGKGNFASVNNAVAWGYTAENLIVYDKTIAGKHRIGFTGLYSIQESHQHNTYVSKDSIDQDFVQFYNLGQANATHPAVVSGGESSSVILSYMARLTYAYDNKYMATLTFRDDASSRLAPGHKWHQYPAGSVAWILSNENFMKGIKYLTNLKLRAGFGQTSNQSFNPYTALGQVGTYNGLGTQGTTGTTIRYNYGGTVVTGYTLQTLPNPNLDWEYTKSTDLGIDFGFLKNRITGSLGYYHQHTDKVLYNVSIPATSGISSNSYFTNVGQIQNVGMELSLSTVNVETRSGFTWSTDLNLFFNRNKVLALSSGVTQDIANQLFVGYSLSSIYDYQKLGIWQKNEAAQAAVYNSVPGQLKLQDYSGPNGKPDGVIDANDKHVIGNGDAKLQGGMTNRFAYKRFDLSFTLYARFGGLLISQIHQPTSLYLTNMGGDRNQIKVDYWTPNNPTNWFPNPANVLSPVGSAFSVLGYYDASFVKVRSINLGYTFAPSVLKRISAQSVRIYASMDNIATLFSPYKKQTGIDPEGTGTGDQSVSPIGNIRNVSGGVNNTITVGASAPPPRNFIIGLNVSF